MLTVHDKPFIEPVECAISKVEPPGGRARACEWHRCGAVDVLSGPEGASVQFNEERAITAADVGYHFWTDVPGECVSQLKVTHVWRFPVLHRRPLGHLSRLASTDIDVEHYHRERNHQGLGNRPSEATVANTTASAGRIGRHQRVGGLAQLLLPRGRLIELDRLFAHGGLRLTHVARACDPTGEFLAAESVCHVLPM